MLWRNMLTCLMQTNISAIVSYLRVRTVPRLAQSSSVPYFTCRDDTVAENLVSVRHARPLRQSANYAARNFYWRGQ
jgi:hypothetical protein